MFKKLHLITSELANDLGIPAESPVFVSSNVRKAEVCSDCNTAYTPLVYQAGYTVMAQHFHGEVGGIFSSALNLIYSGGNGFFAIMETVGRVIESEERVPFLSGYLKGITVQSEGVLVRAIRPFFGGIADDRDGFGLYHHGFLESGTNGLLYPRPYDLSSSMEYVLPSGEYRLFERYKNDFKVSDGTVVFTAQSNDYQYRKYRDTSNDPKPSPIPIQRSYRIGF